MQIPLDQDTSRGDGNLETQPQSLLTSAQSLSSTIPFSQRGWPDVLKTLEFYNSTITQLPSFTLQTTSDKTSLYPQKRAVSISFHVPQWFTYPDLYLVQIDAYVAVPAEEINEIQAENPEKWQVLVDMSKWGTVIAPAIRFVAAAGTLPHRWYITAAVVMLTTARQAGWPILINISFQNRANLNVHLNANVAAEYRGTSFAITERERKKALAYAPDAD